MILDVYLNGVKYNSIFFARNSPALSKLGSLTRAHAGVCLPACKIQFTKTSRKNEGQVFPFEIAFHLSAAAPVLEDDFRSAVVLDNMKVL